MTYLSIMTRLVLLYPKHTYLDYSNSFLTPLFLNIMVSYINRPLFAPWVTLSSVIANIALLQLENDILPNLQHNSIFYLRYIDDIILLIDRRHI